MLIVLLVWAAYLFLGFQIITHKIVIAGFTTSLIGLGVVFFVLVFWSIHHLTTPKKAQREAAQRATAARLAADRATVTAADSGSITFRVAGVTFENDDGTSRQDILRHLKFGDAPWADDPEDLTATIDETTFEGEQAFEVLINGYQVGFVPKTSIRKVAAARDHVGTCFVSDVKVIGGGTGSDGQPISYGCEITLEY